MSEKQDYACCPLNDCGCVGYAFVPVQCLNEVCTAEEGLAMGTIFPELHLTINEYGKVCKANGGVV